jgi:hypothetical protein
MQRLVASPTANVGHAYHTTAAKTNTRTKFYVNLYPILRINIMLHESTFFGRPIADGDLVICYEKYNSMKAIEIKASEQLHIGQGAYSMKVSCHF